MKEILKFKNLLFLSIIILLSSCGKKTIDFDDEKEHITFSYIFMGGNILEYKGIPYTGVIVRKHVYEKTKLRERTDYKKGIKDGISEEYYENGSVKKKGTYKDGKQDGQWEYYHENGQLLSRGPFKDGWRDGQWEYYDENGKLDEKESGMYKDRVKQDD